LATFRKTISLFSQYLLVLGALKINGKKLKFVIICVTTELAKSSDAAKNVSFGTASILNVSGNSDWG